MNEESGPTGWPAPSTISSTRIVSAPRSRRPELDREELNARCASPARAENAQSLMHTGIQYEGEVWQRVLQRLDRRRTSRTVRPFDAADATTEADEDSASRDLQEMEVDELRQIARLRRQLAEQAVTIAEAHRAEV
jgi:hypothetical protein